MSQEVKNSIILIIAVAIALNFIAPSIVGQSANPGVKPVRDIIIVEHSGSLGGKGPEYEPTFPSLFPDSFKEDRLPYTYPQKQTPTLCGLCTCFTGHFDQFDGYPINKYTGEYSEQECKLSCAGMSMSFIGFTPSEQVTCNYNRMQ